MKKFCILVAVAAAMVAAPVAAARHLNFTGFFSRGPYPTVSGTLDYDLVNNNFTLLGRGLTIGTTTLPAQDFDFYPYPAYGDIVRIRGSSDFGTYVFLLDLNASTGRVYDGGDLVVGYDTCCSPEYSSDSVRLNWQTGDVPEPATWAMMLVGFGAVGYGVRRKNTQLRVTYA